MAPKAAIPKERSSSDGLEVSQLPAVVDPIRKRSDLEGRRRQSAPRLVPTRVQVKRHGISPRSDGRQDGGCFTSRSLAAGDGDQSGGCFETG